MATPASTRARITLELFAPAGGEKSGASLRSSTAFSDRGDGATPESVGKFFGLFICFPAVTHACKNHAANRRHTRAGGGERRDVGFRHSRHRPRLQGLPHLGKQRRLRHPIDGEERLGEDVARGLLQREDLGHDVQEAGLIFPPRIEADESI